MRTPRPTHLVCGTGAGQPSPCCIAYIRLITFTLPNIARPQSNWSRRPVKLSFKMQFLVKVSLLLMMWKKSCTTSHILSTAITNDMFCYPTEHQCRYSTLRLNNNQSTCEHSLTSHDFCRSTRVLQKLSNRIHQLQVRTRRPEHRNSNR